MFKKILALLLISLLTIGLLAGCGGDGKSSDSSSSSGSEDTIVINVGHVLAPTHPYTLGLEKFAELVEDKTDGKIHVEVFHSS